MKWLIVVIFANVQGDLYIFTDPTFDTREVCMQSINDKEDQKKYVRKLVLEYGKVMPIRGINCLQEDTIRQILEEHQSEKNGVKT